jgi:hypothetical protein
MFTATKTIKPSPASQATPALTPDEALKLAMGDPQVRRLAAQCRHVMLQLSRRAFPELIRHAAEASQQGGDSPCCVLATKLATLQQELVAVTARNADAEASRKAASADGLPLLMRVAQFGARLESKLAGTEKKIAGAEQARAQSVARGMQSGLSLEEMKLLGRLEPSDATVVAWQASRTLLKGQIEQIAAFNRDPLKQLTHLRGLVMPGVEIPEA